MFFFRSFDNTAGFKMIHKSLVSRIPYCSLALSHARRGGRALRLCGRFLCCAGLCLRCQNIVDRYICLREYAVALRSVRTCLAALCVVIPLCCAVLCCAVLCCAVLCCAVLAILQYARRQRAVCKLQTAHEFVRVSADPANLKFKLSSQPATTKLANFKLSSPPAFGELNSRNLK